MAWHLIGQLAAQDGGARVWLYLAGGAILLMAFFVAFIIVVNYGKLWLQAYVSNARVSMLSLVGMSFRQVKAKEIVTAKIMAMQRIAEMMISHSDSVYYPLGQIVTLYCRAGMKEEALEWLEKAYEDRDGLMVFL